MDMNGKLFEYLATSTHQLHWATRPQCMSNDMLEVRFQDDYRKLQ